MVVPPHGAQKLNNTPLQRPPPSPMIWPPASPMMRLPASPMMRPPNMSQPGSLAMARPYSSLRPRARPPSGPFIGQGQQGVPASPAMTPIEFYAGPNGQSLWQPSTPRLQHQQQQPLQQGQDVQGQDIGASHPAPPSGAHKPKRVYQTGINAEPSAGYDTAPNGSFQQSSFPPQPAVGVIPMQPATQGSQFFVPGESQGPAFGQPVPAYQQGLQPLAGQPLQPNMSQLSNQMGAMHVGGGSFSAQGIIPVSTVSLMGSSPKVTDLDAPPPTIILPETGCVRAIFTCTYVHAPCRRSYATSILDFAKGRRHARFLPLLWFSLAIAPPHQPSTHRNQPSPPQSTVRLRKVYLLHTSGCQTPPPYRHHHQRV
ncbi:MAG: hypothetical protein J3Q66DRAFT_391081 [Benniella sp.]|nr:MAG: hypothetical protein J3Q66DRAFT_391081 [Benniella sp.]